MKKYLLATLAALALLVTPQARAWTYTDGDVLLVFRDGSRNVEFDLGSVTNFLGKTNGYTTTVTGFNWSLVTSAFSDLSTVDYVLVAAAGTTNWITGASPNTTAYNVSQQKADTLYNLISGAGLAPNNPIAIATAGANAYSIDAHGKQKKASYDFVVSGGGNGYIPTLGGNLPFTVEQPIPGSLDFWEIKPTTIYPNPPPDRLIGRFSITDSGVLTFVAGPPASTITGLSRAGTISTVQFTTTIGNTYSLAYTNKLGGAAGTWPVEVTTVTGNGDVNTLNRTNSTGAEFYQVKAQ